MIVSLQGMSFSLLLFLFYPSVKQKVACHTLWFIKLGTCSRTLNSWTSAARASPDRHPNYQEPWNSVQAAGLAHSGKKGVNVIKVASE